MDRESTWQKMTLECLGYHDDGTVGTPTSLPDHVLATTAMRAEVVQASKILFLLDFISSCKEDGYLQSSLGRLPNISHVPFCDAQHA